MINVRDVHGDPAIIDPECVMYVRVASGFDPDDLYRLTCVAFMRDGHPFIMFGLNDGDTVSDAMARAMRMLGRKVVAG
jgi:hypothetical protein